MGKNYLELAESKIRGIKRSEELEKQLLRERRDSLIEKIMTYAPQLADIGESADYIYKECGSESIKDLLVSNNMGNVGLIKYRGTVLVSILVRGVIGYECISYYDCDLYEEHVPDVRDYVNNLYNIKKYVPSERTNKALEQFYITLPKFIEKYDNFITNNSNNYNYVF